MPGCLSIFTADGGNQKSQTGGGGGGSRYLCRHDTSVRLSMQIAALEKLRTIKYTEFDHTHPTQDGAIHVRQQIL
jgi:hypothetical protein